MTSYQDQPLSRREIREREAAATRAAEAGSTTGAPAPADAAAGEPLDYATRSRAPIPPYDAPLSQPGVSPVTPDDGTAAFRYRDYSPEASGPARHGVAPAAPADLDYRTLNRPDAPVPQQPAAPTSFVSAPPVSDPALETSSAAPYPEATMSRRELRAFREAQERAAEQPAASVPPVAPVPSVPPVAPAPSAPPVASAQPVPTYPSAPPAPSWPAAPPPASAPPAYAPPASGPAPVTDAPAPPPLVEPAAPSTDASADLEALFRAQTAGGLLQPEASASAAPAPVVPTPASATPAPVAPPPVESPPVEPQQAAPAVPQAPPVPQVPDLRAFTAGLQPPSPFDPVPAPPAPAQRPPEPEASVSQPPVAGERPRNHWSRQAELDDEAQPPTGSLARDVGARPTTSNALVMPVSPTPDIIVSPLTGGGEVLVTGSISLPASLASTGALPAQLDESDIDNLLDPNDHQVSSTDSQPVRAIRAVSTHTSSREIIGATRPKRGSRALTALIVSAVGMAVVVVALLVVALTSGVLG